MTKVHRDSGSTRIIREQSLQLPIVSSFEVSRDAKQTATEKDIHCPEKDHDHLQSMYQR